MKRIFICAAGMAIAAMAFSFESCVSSGKAANKEMSITTDGIDNLTVEEITEDQILDRKAPQGDNITVIENRLYR
jgi:hypothetical protein